MREFRFLRQNTHFTDTATEIYGPWESWIYENRYRWNVPYFELIGVTPPFYNFTISSLPVKSTVYREISSGDILTGNIISSTHEMYNHPNVIDI